MMVLTEALFYGLMTRYDRFGGKGGVRSVENAGNLIPLYSH